MPIPAITPDQARKIVLHSQNLPPSKPGGSALAATLTAIEQLGYIQIDTISVVERAHHHTLWNRNPCYQPAQLDQLLADQQVFEYWAHAAAYLPMRDYRFSLPRKQAIASGERDHWYARDPKLMRYVLDRIRAEGPLQARDFVHQGEKLGEWQTKPAKRALEYLFMQGDLMVPRRINFHKVYDLTERVLPTHIDQRPPTAEEHARFLITRFLAANGLAQAADFSYLLKDVKPLINALLPAMLEAGELQQVQVAGLDWYALPDALSLLDKPLQRRSLKILSPFDNLLIQRERMRRLFDFDYQIECYTPAAKRQYGYFSLPVLWDGQLVARMDCKAERKTGVLQVHHLALEAGVQKPARLAAFKAALQQEMQDFMQFNGCSGIKGLG